MTQNNNLKNFCNQEYRGKIVLSQEGTITYWISCSDCHDWICVGEDIYALLAHDPERMMKSNSRYYQRTRSVDAVYEGTVENHSALNFMESLYPQMSSISAEDTFNKKCFLSNLRAYILDLGNDWLDLFDAIFILEIPTSDYAEQIGKPASTVRSRKARLLREIKKFLRKK
ncbi:MAG TPA: hypothetical protein H9756_02345 [Candidatus Mediterraneibacter gallistercoris]|uniref:Sigma-70 family RNA polymerase sigma factor n=1 Tax=Candidatus Mediterraneibacter gallistercoris TaxID=2838671 RepID=A0A9D2T1W0_9FIRM|nr:hypothetical protein [Candidatus Mediterraneibacter gallistercoris]